MDVLNNEFLLFLKCAQTTGLRYLLIGGYAVNYYVYNRNTADMDIWIAPNNQNRQLFINTLLCMSYSEQEVAPLYNEDFTQPFVGTIGSADSTLDILTVVHHTISFDEADDKKKIFEIQQGLFLNIVPYEILKQMKLRTNREKDIFDIARLEEIRSSKNSSE